MTEQGERPWCEDIDGVWAYGTTFGFRYRCRRCGRVWKQSVLKGVLRIGPCLGDAIPNWVGEG